MRNEMHNRQWWWWLNKVELLKVAVFFSDEVKSNHRDSISNGTALCDVNIAREKKNQKTKIYISRKKVSETSREICNKKQKQRDSE